MAFRPFETTNTFSPVVAVHCAVVGAKKKHIIDGNPWLTWQALPSYCPRGRERSSGKCNHKRFHDQKHLGLKKKGVVVTCPKEQITCGAPMKEWLFSRVKRLGFFGAEV